MSRIYRRLDGLGYSKEDYFSYQDDEGWAWNALIDQPRELSERGEIQRNTYTYSFVHILYSMGYIATSIGGNNPSQKGQDLQRRQKSMLVKPQSGDLCLCPVHGEVPRSQASPLTRRTP